MMARKKPKTDNGVVLFDVLYEDGSRASNRKVPAADLGGFDGDAPALTFIMDQDRRIAELSGKAPRPIEKLVRSGAKPPRSAEKLARTS
jgi:hypothetical protein